MTEFNKELCDEKHSNVNKDIAEIKAILASINDKLDSKFITRNEAKVGSVIISLFTTITGFILGIISYKH